MNSTASSTDAGPVAPRAFDPDHRASTIGLLALVTMFAFEAVAVSLAMPSVARDLDGETLYPIAVIGMLTAAIVGMVVGGIWSDARGPGRALLLGGLGFVVGLVVSGVADTMPVFVAGRLLQGLGSGLALTAMYVVVGDCYPSALRPRVFSLFSVAWVLPSIVGPVVTGFLVDVLGWRSVFLVVAVFALASTAFVRLATARRVHVRTAPLVWGRRPLYALIAVAGVLALHFAGHGAGVGTLLLLIVGLAVLAVSLPVLLPRGSLVAKPGLPAVVAARGVFGAAFACVEMFLPLVLQDETRLTPTVTGLLMMVGALGWTAGSNYSGTRSGSVGFTRLLAGGAAFLLVGSLVLLGLVPLDHQPVAASVIATGGFALMAVGMGTVTPLLSTLALDLAPEGRQGESGSAIQMSDALGQSIAAGVVGAVFARWFVADQGTSYLSGFGLAVLLAVVAAVVVVRIRGGGADGAHQTGDATDASPAHST